MHPRSRLAVLFAVSVCLGPVRAQDGEPVPWSSTARDVPGEVVWLEAAGERFPALHAPASASQPLGAVLIAHGLGRHADWPAVVRPLRVELARSGWHTLSVQLPAPFDGLAVEAQQDLATRAVARLDAGRQLLSSIAEVDNVVILGHRWGAGPGILLLEPGLPEEVTGYVALAPTFTLPGPTRDQAIDILEVREVPVLIVETAEPPEAEPSRLLPRPPKGDAPRRRIVIDTADETLGDSAEIVIKRLRAWLLENAMPPG